MHCASYHPHDICGDELGGRSASISKARQQGMVFCSSHHDPWASNDQLWSKKNLPPKRIIGIISVSFSYSTWKSFHISKSEALQHCWAFLSRRVKACVRAKYTPIVALAWHFSPKIVYSHINFSSKQLLHWGRKLAYGSLTVYSQLFFGQQLFFSQDPRWKS